MKNVLKVFIGLFFVFVFISFGLGIDSSYSGFTIFLAFLFGAIGVYLYFQSEKDAEVILTEKLVSNLKGVEGLNVTQSFLTKDYKGLIAIDEDNQKVCFLEYDVNQIKFNVDDVKTYKVTSTIFNYKDILKAEVIEDGETVTKTSRSSQLGGALIGGVLAGGVGAIIGGLSGSTSSSEKIQKIHLKIIINDTKKPVRLLSFLNEPFSIDKFEQKYIDSNNKVLHWYGLLKVLIQKADKEDKDIEKIENQEFLTSLHSKRTTPNSIADEIKKLSELHKEGILSEEEFSVQKQKLLS